MRVIANAREQDWNTCGQAAVASLLAHFGAGPFEADPTLDDGAAIDLVSARFGPDVPFGLGTSVRRIASALRVHGLHVEIVHSGPFGGRALQVLERVRHHVGRGIPVPVCVDLGLLDGPPWSAHWALATAFGERAVELGNTGPRWVPMEVFLRTWRCRHLPPPYHHCAVLASAGPAA